MDENIITHRLPEKATPDAIEKNLHYCVKTYEKHHISADA